MSHNHVLVMGSADLVVNLRLQVQDDIAIGTEVRDEIEQIMMLEGYINDAPFKFVSLMLRYGLKNEEIPHYQKISKKYRDLPLAIELDANELRIADRNKFKNMLTIATVKSLIHAGQKYNLPHAMLLKHLEESLGN